MTSPAHPALDESTRAEIGAFVSSVEKALGDLPADDVTELTGGLEADLTEAWAAEGTTPTQRFGSPQAYAADLRSAAGLPPPAAPASRIWLAGRTYLDDLQRVLSGLPAAPVVGGWAKELQPAWWVLRGPLALVLVMAFLVELPGDALLTLIVASLVLAVISLRWKAAGMATGHRQIMLWIWNAVAVVGLLSSWSVFTSYYVTYAQASSWTASSSGRPRGLFSGDEPVTNVFAYDANGAPLSRVRLYDQNGDPLVVSSDERDTMDDAGNSVKLVPDSGDGPAEWNLFPLASRILTAQQMQAGATAYGPLTQSALPYQEVPALPPSTLLTKPGTEPSAEPSATPSAVAPAKPSAEPSVTPSTTPPARPSTPDPR